MSLESFSRTFRTVVDLLNQIQIPFVLYGEDDPATHFNWYLHKPKTKDSLSTKPEFIQNLLLLADQYLDIFHEADPETRNLATAEIARLYTLIRDEVFHDDYLRYLIYPIIKGQDIESLSDHLLASQYSDLLEDQNPSDWFFLHQFVRAFSELHVTDDLIQEFVVELLTKQFFREVLELGLEDRLADNWWEVYNPFNYFHTVVWSWLTNTEYDFETMKHHLSRKQYSTEQKVIGIGNVVTRAMQEVQSRIKQLREAGAGDVDEDDDLNQDATIDSTGLTTNERFFEAIVFMFSLLSSDDTTESAVNEAADIINHMLKQGFRFNPTELLELVEIWQGLNHKQFQKESSRLFSALLSHLSSLMRSAAEGEYPASLVFESYLEIITLLHQDSTKFVQLVMLFLNTPNVSNFVSRVDDQLWEAFYRLSVSIVSGKKALEKIERLSNDRLSG